MTAEELNKLDLQDGIYEILPHIIVEELKDCFEDNISYLVSDEGDHQSLQFEAFLHKYPQMCLANAYETHVIFMLSEAPPIWKGKKSGSGFNYGSTNILENCPPKLLILAQND